ncbi:MAG: tRNA (adenosine(37)-N6)-threonylcarbamoyltransferase complex dimerization subunit type 1 TsaB [Lachnospiraceae bacterium]|nr:tRNA (adenosine(37)-N6)-threonylcarbamoyltransferase complex dimerization subunit type 1 TsaB [Lachnospiraceae bacterium]
MKILAVDSSGLVASVAIVEDDVLKAEYTTNFKKTHSQTLMPMIDEIVRMTETDLATMDAIAVAKGPGSYTGLRIGSATVKGLALVLDKPIIAVPTVEGLAYNLYGTNRIICPLMDARRNQVYTGLYKFEGDAFHVLKEQAPLGIEEIIEEINTLSEPVIFLGDGVLPYKDKIEEMVKVPFLFAPAHLAAQRAGALALRAKEMFLAGQIETADEHKPDYLRLSQAERERNEREQSGKERV